ncbi:MAG: hypothetical protein ACRBBS_08075 [Thalassovita sp.]
MRWVFALLFYACCTSALLAAPIVVKSGDHDGFTRVVLHLPSGNNWKTAEVEKGLRLEFPGAEPEFDLSQAFTRIGRDRVAAIASDAKGLTVSFGCECVAKAYSNGARMIVVDVSPGPKAAAVEETASYNFPDPAMVLARSRNQSTSPNIAKELVPQVPVQRVADSELAKRRLLKQLGRAASMGLVELTIPDERVDKVDLPHVTKHETGLLAHHAGIDAFPVQSPEIVGELNAEKVSEKGVDCPPDSLLDTAQWVQGEDFAAGLRELRLHLGGEVVAVDPVVALQLVRHYLAFGFGSEAQMLLPYAGNQPDIKWLQFIANIVDGMDGAATKDLTKYASCQTSVAMWALLAQKPDDQLDVYDPAPVLRAFSDLTMPLQELLAPRLGAAFLERGNDEAAQTILRIVERRTTPMTAEVDHLGAKIHTRSGGDEMAKEKLVSTVQADAPISPIALAELIESEIRQGRAISSETVDLLASYYQQHRRDEVAPRLLTVLILANALAGQFEESWSLMESAHEDIRQSTEVRSGFARALADHGSDLDAMRYGTVLARKGTKLTAESSQLMAKRLLEIGFPDVARQFLSTPAQGVAEHNRKLLLAKIALHSNETLTAKAHLLGLVGPDVEAMLRNISEKDDKASKLDQIANAPKEIEGHSLDGSKASLLASKELREHLTTRLNNLTVGNGPPD